MKKEHQAIIWAIVGGVLINVIASYVFVWLESKREKKQCSTK